MDDDDDAHLRVTMNELYPQEVNSSKTFPWFGAVFVSGSPLYGS